MRELKGKASGIFGVSVIFDQWEHWDEGFFSSKELAEACAEEYRKEHKGFFEEVNVWEVWVDCEKNS
jgi:predicted amidophosphoribosyltransferase